MLHFFRHRPVADQDIYAVWYTIIHTQAKTYLTQQMFSSITHTLTLHYFAASSIIDSPNPSRGALQYVYRIFITLLKTYLYEWMSFASWNDNINISHHFVCPLGMWNHNVVKTETTVLVYRWVGYWYENRLKEIHFANTWEKHTTNYHMSMRNTISWT